MTDEDAVGQPESTETTETIPQELAVEQRPVPFLGDDLAAAMTEAGTIYITLAGMCRALGMDTRAQIRRIQRTPSLAKGLRVIPLETRGGVQPVNCLRLDRVALWLAGVETTRIKPQYREKIEAYQDDLAPVAMQVFLRSVGAQPPAPAVAASTSVVATATQIGELAEQLDTLTGVVTFLGEHLDAQLSAAREQIGAMALRLDDALALFEALGERQSNTEGQVARIDERTQRLTPAHARSIQEQVEQMVHATKNAAIPLSFAIIYGRLKHHFRANSYREIADEQYSTVMDYLREMLRQALGGEGPAQRSLF